MVTPINDFVSGAGNLRNLKHMLTQDFDSNPYKNKAANKFHAFAETGSQTAPEGHADSGHGAGDNADDGAGQPDVDSQKSHAEPHGQGVDTGGN